MENEQENVVSAENEPSQEAPDAVANEPAEKKGQAAEETVAEVAKVAGAADGILMIDNFRPSLVGGRYQAQVKCPECGGWVLTDNLEVHREGEGEDSHIVAEAFDVICKKQSVPPCGYELGHIVINGWLHSAPIKWREETEE